MLIKSLATFIKSVGEHTFNTLTRLVDDKPIELTGLPAPKDEEIKGIIKGVYDRDHDEIKCINIDAEDENDV